MLKIVLQPNTIAHLYSESIVENLPEFRERKNHIRYGLEWIISGFYQIMLVLILGIIFGAVKETLTCLIIGAMYRSFAGGIHFSKYFTCLLSGTVQIMTIALLAKYIDVNEMAALQFSVFSFIWGVIITYLKAPKLGRKKKLFTEKKKTFSRTLSIFILTAVFIFGMIAGFDTSIFISAWLALLFQIFTITLMGERIITRLDQKIHNKGEKGK